MIGGTERRGANLRRDPGFTAVVCALPDGTLVQLVGRRAVVDGVTWAEVLLQDGRVGWVGEQYVVPYQTFLLP